MKKIQLLAHHTEMNELEDTFNIMLFQDINITTNTWLSILNKNTISFRILKTTHNFSTYERLFIKRISLTLHRHKHLARRAEEEQSEILNTQY